MRANIVVAAIVMVVVTLALFFIPLVNGIVGGAVGGYLAGSWRRGLSAAVVPAVFVAFGVWLLLIAFHAPVMGFFAGLGVGIVIVVASIGMLLGAAFGGMLAEQRRVPV